MLIVLVLLPFLCDANDAAGTWNEIARMPRKNKHYEYDYFAETLSFVGKRGSQLHRDGFINLRESFGTSVEFLFKAKFSCAAAVELSEWRVRRRSELFFLRQQRLIHAMKTGNQKMQTTLTKKLLCYCRRSAILWKANYSGWTLNTNEKIHRFAISILWAIFLSRRRANHQPPGMQHVRLHPAENCIQVSSIDWVAAQTRYVFRQNQFSAFRSPRLRDDEPKCVAPSFAATHAFREYIERN